jgi:hypothetical protein
LLIVQVAWTAAFGAQYYIVQTSTDGEHWEQEPLTVKTSIQVQVFPGDLYVRVAAVNSGQGPWIQEYMLVGTLASLNESIPWEALEWEVTWFAVSYAVGYLVKVYDNSESEPVLKRTTTVTDLSYLYDYTMATTDLNIVREMLVTVDPIFIDDDTGLPTPSGFPVSLELSNAIPDGPDELVASTFLSADDDYAYYAISWTPGDLNEDVNRTKIWLSTTPGIDPEVDVPFYSFTLLDPAATANIGIPLDSADSHPLYYFRVAQQDVWGDEMTVTTEHTLPAYP